MEKDFNGGKPIEEAWFTDNLSGGHNPECIAMLFPGISKADNDAIAIDKEARFRKLAGTLLLLVCHAWGMCTCWCLGISSTVKYLRCEGKVVVSRHSCFREPPLHLNYRSLLYKYRCVCQINRCTVLPLNFISVHEWHLETDITIRTQSTCVATLRACGLLGTQQACALHVYMNNLHEAHDSVGPPLRGTAHLKSC